MDWLWNLTKYFLKGFVFVVVLSLLVPLTAQQEGGILLFYLVWPGLYKAAGKMTQTIEWKKALHRQTPAILSKHLAAKRDPDKKAGNA